MLETGKQLTNMFRAGWKIVVDNPTITAGAFINELESTTPFIQSDWIDGSEALIELGYLPDAVTWITQRAWFESLDVSIGVNIRDMLQGYFLYSPHLQTVLLTYQKNELESRKTTLENAITNVIDPWLASPPDGTHNFIIIAVQNSRDNALLEIEQLTIAIEAIDQKLGELQ